MPRGGPYLEVFLRGVTDIELGLKGIHKELARTREDDRRILEKVKERAKLYAPRDTGKLEGSIEIKPTTKGNRVVAGGRDAYYAVFQELGFTPHTVPIEWIRHHMSPGRFITNPSGFARVRRHTPFLRKAQREILGTPGNWIKYRNEKGRWASGITRKYWGR